MPPQTETPTPLDVSVVAHTHWDREWYHAAPRFRQRLIALVDALLALPDDVSTPFLLDGQAVVVEDYLKVRPENATAIQQRLQSGALEAGPWYVLADNLIPSGEAIIRNLLTGRRVLASLGAVAPPVAYCPDTFGHPAALPVIASGFGLQLAIVWRGFGGEGTPGSDTFRWQAPSGESVVLYHLPPDGYETGSALPGALAQMEMRWAKLRALLRSRSTVGVTLLQNGADHHALQPDIVAVLEQLQSLDAHAHVRRESLSAFASRLLQAVNAHTTPLIEVRGELRNSYGYAWTLQGTLGTRAAQKRENAHAERALVRDAEPWSVLAYLHGNEARRAGCDGTIKLSTLPSLFDAAWRDLLRAHPHDTLCGCSIDAVARAMNVRMESARTQAVGLREASIALALRHDVVQARSLPVVSGAVVVRNRSAHARGGVVEMIVDEKLADVAVGPGSGVGAVNAKVGMLSDETSAHGSVGHGSTAPAQFAKNVAPGVTLGGVPMQFGKSRVVFRRRESPQHYPDNDLVRAHYALAWVSHVPALGVSVHPLTPAGAFASNDGGGMRAGGVDATHSEIRTREVLDAADTSVLPATVHTSQDQSGTVSISNGIVQVSVTREGVSITCENRAIENAVRFVTESDLGDAYTPSIRDDGESLTVKSFRVVGRGPLRASVEVHWTTRAEKRGVRVAVTFVVDAGASAVRMEVKGDNQRRNHRLRMLMRSDVASSHTPHGQRTLEQHDNHPRTFEVFADAALGSVRREPLNIASEIQHDERVLTTMPLHRWVCVSSLIAAATVHSDGLAECEVLRDGTVALTLLRAIGQLSRNDIAERPGHAGWPAPIPLAQSLGKFRARVGLELHEPWSDAAQQRIERTSDTLLLPLTGHTIRDLAQAAPTRVAGAQLEGVSLRFSAAKLADDNDGMVLRCINDSTAPQEGAWTLPHESAWEFAPARLDETLTGPWQRTGARIPLLVRANGVETIRVRHAR